MGRIHSRLIDLPLLCSTASCQRAGWRTSVHASHRDWVAPQTQGTNCYSAAGFGQVGQQQASGADVALGPQTKWPPRVHRGRPARPNWPRARSPWLLWLACCGLLCCSLRFWRPLRLVSSPQTPVDGLGASARGDGHVRGTLDSGGGGMCKFTAREGRSSPAELAKALRRGRWRPELRRGWRGVLRRAATLPSGCWAAAPG